MKVLIVLSCIAAIVICQPTMHRQRHLRKRPPHLLHKHQDLSHHHSEARHSDVLPSHSDQETSTKHDAPVQENKEPSHSEQNLIEKTEPIQENKENEKSEPVQKNKDKEEFEPDENMKSLEHKSSHSRRSHVPMSEAKYQRLPALRHEEIHDEYGQYALRYITADNTVVSERGRLVPTKDGGYVLEIEGKYQFVGDDGQIYVTSFRGGPDGFHVVAKHLPVQVPMPAI